MTTLSGRVATVSVIVPCRNEEGYIAACLDSILASDYPRASLEVLVLDGRSDDGTRRILDDYASRYPIIRVVENPGRIASIAVNLGIRAARGEILVRMDAHLVYPTNYIGDLVAALQQTGADNVGGVLMTLPANQTAMARAIAIGTSHPFGVGNAYFRIGIREPRWVDTVAFFCCRRETFERVGMFDEELARGEDEEFNGRLLLHGGRTLLVPSVVAYYYARDTLPKMARTYHQYAYFKPIVARKLGRVVTVRQLVPPGFLLAQATTTILSPWVDAAGFLSGATAAAYLLAVLGFSITAGRKAGFRGIAALAIVFPVLHFSYGLGFLRRTVELALGPGGAPRSSEVPLSR